MPAAEVPGRIDEILGLVGLDGKRGSMVKGLSRGMRQRLGLGRALIHRPEVLLLDEPASGLDPKARADLRTLLRAVRDQGTTILISSHILSDLEDFSTSIGLMERGRMTRSGRIDEIATTERAARAVRVRWATGHGRVVEARLAADARVSGVMVKGSEAVFRFAGPEAEPAGVLAAVMAAGVRVVFFGEARQTIEDLYVRLSHHEVT